MPAGSLLLLLDDIASTLDDIAAMTKIAATKTAAVVGDDLALNANQLTGVAADRELKVVGAVALGSLRNKLILVPAALLISAYVPGLVAPLLVVGGCYLCFEGAEKLAHRTAAGDSDRDSANHRPVRLSEAERIAGAVRTDFVLSAEIIVIAMGAVASSPVIVRVGVLTAVALGMTVGVYGLVAVIVKLDDAGLLLSRLRGPAPAVAIPRLIGRLLLGAVTRGRGHGSHVHGRRGHPRPRHRAAARLGDLGAGEARPERRGRDWRPGDTRCPDRDRRRLHPRPGYADPAPPSPALERTAASRRMPVAAAAPDQGWAGSNSAFGPGEVSKWPLAAFGYQL